MGALADYLSTCDPVGSGVNLANEDWAAIVKAIKAQGLEAALHSIAVTDDVGNFIRWQTAKLMLEKESEVVTRVFGGKQTLKLSKLMPHLPQDSRLQIVTTNYDRLIELAAEVAGFKVDGRAFGLYNAAFAPSHPYAYCERVEWFGKTPRRVERRVVSVLKPHGSLDWFMSSGSPIRSGFALGPENALIITPGQNKYRAGYDQPFDLHREAANKAVDESRGLLILGYGFNDDHLETHIRTRIAAGIPCVMLTRSLTANTLTQVQKYPSIMAVDASPDDENSTRIHFQGQIVKLANQRIWDIDGFVSGVMQS